MSHKPLDSILDLLDPHLNCSELASVLHPTGTGASTLVAGVAGKLLIDGLDVPKAKIPVFVYGEQPRSFVDRLTGFLQHYLPTTLGPENAKPLVTQLPTIIRDRILLFEEDERSQIGFSSKFTEHRRAIEAHLETDSTLQAVIVDGLDSYMEMTEAKILRPKLHVHLARMLQSYLGGVRSFAAEHECPIWVTHHVGGKALGLHHTERILPERAEIARWFPQEFDRCFTLGNPSAAGWTRLDLAKPRVHDANCQVIRRSEHQWFDTAAQKDHEEFFRSTTNERCVVFGPLALESLRDQHLRLVQREQTDESREVRLVEVD